MKELSLIEFLDKSRGPEADALGEPECGSNCLAEEKELLGYI